MNPTVEVFQRVALMGTFGAFMSVMGILVSYQFIRHVNQVYRYNLMHHTVISVRRTVMWFLIAPFACGLIISLLLIVYSAIEIYATPGA